LGDCLLWKILKEKKKEKKRKEKKRKERKKLGFNVFIVTKIDCAIFWATFCNRIWSP
jgi:heme/copper-type cytochrome/quinol oxidase subunit 3